VLLTGDNALAARSLAEQAGIRDVHAALLPEDKVQRVQALRDAGQHVLVVGDGINDAPALATANLGVAMGRHGSDLTLQTADAVLVRDDLTALPALLRLSRAARRAVVQNLVLATLAIVGLPPAADPAPGLTASTTATTTHPPATTTETPDPAPAATAALTRKPRFRDHPPSESSPAETPGLDTSRVRMSVEERHAAPLSQREAVLNKGLHRRIRWLLERRLGRGHGWFAVDMAMLGHCSERT